MSEALGKIYIAVDLNLVHYGLLGSLHPSRVAAGEVGAGDLQIKAGLPERFVFGV